MCPPTNVGGGGGTLCNEATQYCLVETDSCTDGGQSGPPSASASCQPIPANCEPNPKCSCVATSDETCSQTSNGAITVIARDDDSGGSTFACGPTLTCNGRTQYCEVDEPGVMGPPDGGGFPPSYSCKPIPTTCNSPDICSCIEMGGILPGEQCSETCGNTTVTTKGV